MDRRTTLNKHIYCYDIDDWKTDFPVELLNKQILYAASADFLGSYGILIGWDIKNSRFKVYTDHPNTSPKIISVICIVKFGE